MEAATIGRPKGRETDFEVFVYQKSKGRVQPTSVCKLTARTKDKAEEKAINFCTMLGYEFSHIVKC